MSGYSRCATCGESPAYRASALCRKHYLETMSAVRDSMDRRPKGRTAKGDADAPNHNVEADAKAVAVAVLKAGGGTRDELRGALLFDLPRFNMAQSKAVEHGWISSPQPRVFEPGDTFPTGKLPVDVRAAMLARFLRAQPADTWTPALSAAKAIGLDNTSGAFVRVTKAARENGTIESSNQGLRAIRDPRRHIPADEIQRRRDAAQETYSRPTPTRADLEATAAEFDALRAA